MADGKDKDKPVSGQEKLEHKEKALKEEKEAKVKKEGITQRTKDHAPVRTEITNAITMPQAVMILTGKGMKITPRSRNIRIIQR